MQRIKSFTATGIAPSGVLFAGDLNAIEDACAAAVDFTQTIGLSVLEIGDSSIQLSKAGTGEAQLSSSLLISNTLYLGATDVTLYKSAAATLKTDGALVVGGLITGNGGGLTGIPTSALTGNISAAIITSGTLADARLSANVPLLNAASNSFTGDIHVAGLLYASAGGIHFNDGTTQTTSAVSAGGSGHFIGEIIKWPGLSLPSFGTETWGWTDGSAVSRATYATLLTRYTLAQNGTRTASSNIISGLTSTAGLSIGMLVEGAGIPANTTITSIDSSSQVHISQNATSSGTSTVTIFPHGNGDGSTTFNIPDTRGRSVFGLALSGGHLDVSGMGNNEGKAAANRRPKHYHTNGLTATSTFSGGALPNHGHSDTISFGDTGHVHPENPAQEGSSFDASFPLVTLDGQRNGYNSLNTGTGTASLSKSGSVGNPTSNPVVTGSVSTGLTGTIGSSTSDAQDSAAYLVLGLPVRLA